jgi:hypothetical protein
MRLFALLFAAMSACYVEDRPVEVVANADGAELIAVEPGIEVVADWGAPVFFVDDYYWWFDGGAWWWSPWYRDGWQRAPYLPPRLAAFPHPERYAHYHPDGWAPHNVYACGNAPVTIHSRPAPRGGGHR